MGFGTYTWGGWKSEFASRINSVCAIFEMDLHGHLELAFWICRDPGSCISPCIQRIKLRTQLHEMKIRIEPATVHRTQRTANHIRFSGVLYALSSTSQFPSGCNRKFVLLINFL